MEEHHPDVPIWTAAIDRELDENAYIRPGLGDAGDRVFGTASRPAPAPRRTAREGPPPRALPPRAREALVHRHARHPDDLAVRSTTGSVRRRRAAPSGR